MWQSLPEFGTGVLYAILVTAAYTFAVGLAAGRGQPRLLRSARLGAYFLDRLREIDSPWVKEVRGKGLWIGIELHREAGGARRFCEALQKEGLLCKETHDHVIRIAPPLVIDRAGIDWALERLAKVLAA